MEPTWIIQASLPICQSFITHAKSLLPREVIFTGLGNWTSLGDHYPPYHMGPELQSVDFWPRNLYGFQVLTGPSILLGSSVSRSSLRLRDATGLHRAEHFLLRWWFTIVHAPCIPGTMISPPPPILPNSLEERGTLWISMYLGGSLKRVRG